MRRTEFIKAVGGVAVVTGVAGCTARDQSVSDALSESNIFDSVSVDETVLNVGFNENPQIQEESCFWNPTTNVRTCSTSPEDVSVVEWGIKYPQEEKSLTEQPWDWTQELESGRQYKTGAYDFGTKTAGDFTIGARVSNDGLLGGMDGWAEFYFTLNYNSDYMFVAEESAGFDETF